VAKATVSSRTACLVEINDQFYSFLISRCSQAFASFQWRITLWGEIVEGYNLMVAARRGDLRRIVQIHQMTRSSTLGGPSCMRLID
jgi:hypothetical protein